MQIKAKYEIAQRVWVVYENQGEVSVYDDYIDEICVNNEKKIYYILKNDCIDREEDEIVLYEDTETLLKKIKEILESGEK